MNNKEENLQLLCPNCHSLTENFGSSNKNSSRIYRKQKGNLEERYITEKEENLCDTDWFFYIRNRILTKLIKLTIYKDEMFILSILLMLP